MQRVTLKGVLLTALLASNLPGLPGQTAQAAGRLLEVSVRDRDTGREIPALWARGEWWVPGRPGARYGIQVRNRLPERVLAVTAVDGVNVITGQTATWNQSGYVLAGLQTAEITGWRKSDAEVAAFEFTIPQDAYATRTGRPANLGVIGVAVFRECTLAAASIAAPPPAEPAADRADAARSGMPSASAARAASAPAPDADVASGANAETAALARPQLGTGHGARESSWIEHTEFERRSVDPDEVIRIRYDSREHLMALGILPHPRYPVMHPEAFPGSADGSYVPDPPPG